jgi:hypothetical protein
MKLALRIGATAVAAAAIFAGGVAVGQNKYETPGTIIHVVSVKWKADATDEQKLKAIEGVRDVARQIPGIKRIWIRSARVQPRDYNAAFAIEFENRAVADAYAEHAARNHWFEKIYDPIRDASISIQVTN